MPTEKLIYVPLVLGYDVNNLETGNPLKHDFFVGVGKQPTYSLPVELHGGDPRLPGILGNTGSFGGAKSISIGEILGRFGF